MKRVNLSILLGLGLLMNGQSQSAFSLNEAVAYALEHSAEMRIEQLNVADADGQLLEYKSIGIPKLTGDVDYSYFLDIPTQILPDFLSPAVYGVLIQEGLVEQQEIPTGASVPVKFGKDHNITAGLNFNTMLFDFAWIQGLKAQRLFRELVVKNLDVKAYEIRSAVTKAYLAVLITEENAELLDNNIANLQRLLNETQAIYESGFAEKLDVDRLALSLDNLRTQRQNATRLTELTQNLLKFQMGYPVDDDIALSDTFDELTGALSVEQIDLDAPVDFADRPEYRTIELTEQLNDINVEVIKSGYLPSLRANAGISRVLQRDDLFDGEENPWFPSSFVGVSLSVPIFDGLEKKAKMQRAQISREKVSIQKSEFERGVQLQVQNGRIAFFNAQETVQARRDAMTLAQQIYDTTQIKYREGVGSSLELTQAESDLYVAQTNYINALYDLIVAKTDLDIALGNI